MPKSPLNREALIEGYRQYGKPRSSWRVGGEFERLALRMDGRQVSYSEEGGIRQILENLQSSFSWSPVREGSNLIGLSRGGSNITLEPGGQVELATAPHHQLKDLAREVMESQDELNRVTDHTRLVWAASGVSPFTAPENVEWVPKGRYRIMRTYLPERGELAPVMMKSTTSFQAAFDYENEHDCAQKTKALLWLSPLTTALFANSPIRLGEDTGLASSRAVAWTQTDPDRTGFPPTIFSEYTHERWVDYLLDAPMMFIQGDRGWEPAHGRPFRSYLEAGHKGRFPSWEDWELHQTAVFPEVRVKHFIELRGADACPLPIALAGIALWTGVLYDSTALGKALDLCESFGAISSAEARHRQAAEHGLEGVVGDHALRRWAEALFSIGEDGLRRYQPESLGLLSPLKRLLEQGSSPVQFHRQAFRDAPDVPHYLNSIAYSSV